MSLVSTVLVIISVFVVLIVSEEKFCEKERKLLLGGVFSHRKIIYAYSWKEVNGVQLWLVWRFEPKDNVLSQIGKDMTVDNLFKGLPLFKSGFGLDLKCDDASADPKCAVYQDLVFIFFQSGYRVFRFASDAFTAEDDKSKIPWGLRGKGGVGEWAFGASDMEGIQVDGAVFVAGHQPQVFIVWKDRLYSTPVDTKAAGLKWKKIADGKQLDNTLGAFLSGDSLFFNKNEASAPSVLYKYDLSGKEVDKITVWKYFSCDAKSGGASGGPQDRSADQEVKASRNQNIATIVMICVIVAIVLTDIITALFWLAVYRKKAANAS